MSRLYFAAAYARQVEIQNYAVRYAASGAGIAVSSWHSHDQAGVDAGFSAPIEGASITAAWGYGITDLNDLFRSEGIVSFTGSGTRGGRHAEHGFALALRGTRHERFRLIIVGPREHVFHCHPATEVYPDFETFLSREGKK